MCKKFVAVGGKVLLTGKSGIDHESGFVFDVGAEWNGTSDNRGGDDVLPVASLRADFVNDPLFMYQPAEKITLTDGASLGERRRALFRPHAAAFLRPHQYWSPCEDLLRLEGTRPFVADLLVTTRPDWL